MSGPAPPGAGPGAGGGLEEAGGGLQEAAARATRNRWVESRLFELLGAWVSSVPEVEVKSRLATHSLHHGWHAELWRDLVPVGAAAPAAPALPVRPGEDGLVRLLDALGGDQCPPSTLEKLVAVYRVVAPRLVVAYRGQLESARPLADGPTMRWLKHILVDEVEAWQEGERLLQSLVQGPADAERAARQQGRLEALIAGGGGGEAPAVSGS